MSLRHQLKRALSPLFGPFYKGRGHILMFHRVVPESDNPRVHNTVNEISPKQLSALIEFYQSHNVDIISIDDVPDYLKNGSGYFVVFTFDDGYKDNLTEALPVFERYNAPFTVYITTGFPDRTVMIWWYLLENVLLSNDSLEFKWGDQEHRFECGTPQLKEDVFNVIRRIIIDTSFYQQHEQLKLAFSNYTNNPYTITEELAMNWDEVIQLSKSPLVTIGAHTMNHPALNQLSEKEIVKECQGSGQLLSAMIGKPAQHFAYPFGSAHEIEKREISILQKIGFKTATTTRFGCIFLEHINYLYALPRIPVTPNLTLKYLGGIISGRENFVRGSKKRVVTI